MAGVINKIRSKGVIVVTIIGIALVSFVLSDLLQKLYQVVQGGDTPDLLASIAGNKIKAVEFKQKVDEQVFLAEQNQQNQQNRQPVDQERIASDTWNQMVSEIIYQKEYDKLGLVVSEAEFKDMFNMANPDPTVQSIFGSREQIQQVIQMAEKDPNMKFRVQQAEKYLAANRLTNKYNSLIKNGVFVSKAEARRKYEEEQKTINFSYLAVNFSAVADKDFKPTDADYNEVYNENKEEFRIKAPEVIFNYIQLPKSATTRDTLKAHEYLLKCKDEFQKSQNDSAFAVSRNRSSMRYDFAFKNKGDLDPMDAEKIAGIKVDSVVGPFLSGKTLKLVKLSDVSKNDTAPFLKIRHILIQPKGATPADSAKAREDFEVTKLTVNKDNFAQKVIEKSDDQRTKMSGGDLGWYRWGSFGPNTELDRILKGAAKGQIVGGKSAAGYHIVEILDRSVDAIRIATIGYDIDAGAETLDSLNTILDKLRNDADGDSTKFNKLAKERKLVLNTSTSIAPGATSINGLSGGTIKSLIAWGLMKDSNKFFDKVYESDNMMVYGYIKLKMDEGYKPVLAVKDQLKERVFARVKTKKIVDKLNALKSKGDLEAIKNGYPGSFTNVADKVSFASGYIQGLGQDPALVGKAFGQKLNVISAPIVGKTGVYLVKVTAINEPEKKDAKGLEEYRLSLQQNKRNTQIQKVQQGLRESANIKDFRYKHGF